MNKLSLTQKYQEIRSKTVLLCKPLAIEDYVIQSIEDVSPPKWHLAHTSWFFETFVLIPYLKKYKIFNPIFQHLFNSYYQTLGNPYPRTRRGVLSRPTVQTIFNYRDYIDAHLIDFIASGDETELKQFLPVIILGLHHEQQHQELLLMDIKYNFSLDPSFPKYLPQKLHKPTSANNFNLDFISIEGGIADIGNQQSAFCFDNELPLHQVILNPYSIASRLITNSEYLEFIEAGGYEQPQWWLADGWNYIQTQSLKAPLYWQKIANTWHVFTLHGLEELDLYEPVSHVSYFEADAYARFRDCRLPTEYEWENYIHLNKIIPHQGNFLEENNYHPIAGLSNPIASPQQFFGDVWEWTMSPYIPYPGYKAAQGALGEYNGKFMSNQLVLRGGSCITPKSHIRSTYRNFFQPEKRWQFSGIRLAKEL